MLQPRQRILQFLRQVYAIGLELGSDGVDSLGYFLLTVSWKLYSNKPNRVSVANHLDALVSTLLQGLVSDRISILVLAMIAVEYGRSPGFLELLVWGTTIHGDPCTMN